MTNIEGRIIRLELLLQASQDYLRKLEGRVASAEQALRQPLAMMWNGGGGGGTGRPGKAHAGGIGAAAGDTPGAGTVTLWNFDPDTGDMANAGADVDVLNLDTANSADKWVWIELAPDERWYVSPLQCE